MRHFKSILTKAKTIIKDGFDPIEEGINNFNDPIKSIEKLAQKRIVICGGCPNFAEEPIDFLRVEDERIPKASNMMCDECGCTLAYKIRQTIKTCDKWQKQ